MTAKNPLDPLSDYDDSHNQEKKRFGYKNPLNNTPRPEPRKTVKSSKVAGKHIRVTLLLLPELEKEIENLARENGLGKNETARWLLSLGLREYHVNGVRPEIERVTASKVTLPAWKK